MEQKQLTPPKAPQHKVTTFLDAQIKKVGKPVKSEQFDLFTSWTFVKSFDRFKTFEEIADFLHDYVKVKKHKVQSVYRDIPALFYRITQVR